MAVTVNRESTSERAAARHHRWIDVVAGVVLFAAGAVALVATGDDAAGTVSAVSSVALLAGTGLLARGLWRMSSTRLSGAALGLSGGYKSFVAWRYLLVAEPKVTRTTKRLLFAAVAVRCGLAILVAIGVGPDRAGLSNPMWILSLLSTLFLIAVVVWGVLRHSRIALTIFLIGAGLVALGVTCTLLLSSNVLKLEWLDHERMTIALQVSNVVAIFGGLLGFLASFFGCLRAFFTFFTTVPIGGVWIGTSALVMVLAVMSGFETDLRQKIVGSNAHLQIVRDGDFVDWREFKTKLDKLPGVVASTPFVVSEVVVAANNQALPVIIKGIDPDTVGKVTDLVSNLDGGRDAMQRLSPMVPDSRELTVPQVPRTGTVVDPPPADLPTPGDPIDFSSTGAGVGNAPTDAGSAGHGGAHGHVPAHEPSYDRTPGRSPDRALDPDAKPGAVLHPSEVDGTPDDRDGYREAVPQAPPHSDVHGDPHGDLHGGQVEPPELHPSAARPVVDPPPSDLITTDEPPADYSRPDYVPETVIKVSDLPFDAPSASPRTLGLPGILVGKELVKQTHMYTGQEVRVISPLSDPSNPDATGTPIPFNRYYRVAGTFFTGMYEYDLKYVYVSLESLQDFLDRGDAIDGIEVRIVNPDNTDAFIQTFRAAFGADYRVQDWKEINRSLFSALKLEKIAMFLVLGIVILVASFSIVGNLIMVVVEKAKEIALLKTLGASDVGVLQLFAIQGLMIGLIGTVLGVATGLLGCWGAKRFGLPLNPDVYYIDRLPVHVDPTSVVAAAAAGVLISIAATLYPAVVAARVRPAAGMRH